MKNLGGYLLILNKLRMVALSIGQVVLSAICSKLINNRLNFCKKIFFIVFFFLTLSKNLFALSPEERLLDPAQEQRAMQLFTEVKCIVCNGQSIESSSTEFSYEMRKLIREKISAGKNNEEIFQELTKEFGDDVLFSSQKNFMPLLIIAIFSVVLTFIFIGSFFLRR